MHERVPVGAGEDMSKFPQIIIVIITIVHWRAVAEV
jgi:hypothetical protein